MTNKLTALSPSQYQNIFLCNDHNATDMQLIPLELIQSNRGRVGKQEKPTSLKEVKPLMNLTVLIISISFLCLGQLY